MHTSMNVRTVELCCGSAICRQFSRRAVPARAAVAGHSRLYSNSRFLESSDSDLLRHRGVPV